ncbi:MAG: protein-glutamate O-methyltransferase CheR [Pirellulaceae bacterium]|nr:protein-glutamate O-methyltransferase CheR [Pirellulaceae bacterium]
MVSTSDQIDDVLLKKFGKIIYEVAGIQTSDKKRALLSNRLRRRLRATGIANFEEYYHFLCKQSQDSKEWKMFLEEITTHETYLFRNEMQWNWFQKEFLSEIIEKNASRPVRKRLRVWSAACSTGDEAYTVATCCAATLPELSKWNVEIVGTDIGVDTVKRAQNPTFDERAMRLVPSDHMKAYFTKEAGADFWVPKEILTKMTKFKTHNLLKRFVDHPFDMVILKNVMIYFDRASRVTAVNHLTKVVKPGGYLLIGAAEGVSDYLKDDYERVFPWLYRKKGSVFGP